MSEGDNLLDIAQDNELEVEGTSLLALNRGTPTVVHSSKSSRTTNARGSRPPLPLGACGGSCACSTCHVIVQEEDFFDKMEEPSDDENDMLDLAFGLTETSRLGCQVKMSKDLDGLVVKLPTATRNMQVSDFSK